MREIQDPLKILIVKEAWDLYLLKGFLRWAQLEPVGMSVGEKRG